MIYPSEFLQKSFGVSMFFLSLGGTYALITGANFNASMAGAKITINRQLETVEELAKTVKTEANELKREPKASRLKLEAVEKTLDNVERKVKVEEKAIEKDLDRYVQTD